MNAKFKFGLVLSYVISFLAASVTAFFLTVFFMLSVVFPDEGSPWDASLAATASMTCLVGEFLLLLFLASTFYDMRGPRSSRVKRLERWFGTGTLVAISVTAICVTALLPLVELGRLEMFIFFGVPLVWTTLSSALCCLGWKTLSNR